MTKVDAIKKQVEFYFSESNFRKDVFLKAAAESDPEGYVPIATLLTFNKLKKLTTDANEVAEALSTSSEVEVSADKSKLRRAVPIPEQYTSPERTLYVKGYPLGEADITVDSIAAQFSAYGTVNMVKMRKGFDRSFKGSVFIEYATVAEMEAANAAAHDANSNVTIQYKGVPFLCVMPFKNWLENKQAKSNKDKKKTGDDNKTRGVKRGAEEEAAEEKSEEFEKGLLLKLKNIPAEANPKHVKDFLRGFADVKYVDNVDKGEATVRLADVEAVQKLRDAIGKGLALPVAGDDSAEGKNLAADAVEGDEEKSFWDNLRKQQKESSGRNHKGGNKYNGKFNGKRSRR